MRQNDARATRTCPSSNAEMPRNSAQFKCEVCNWETKTENLLKGHMTKHVHIKCETCNLQLKTMGMYKRHMKTVHHSNEDIPPSDNTEKLDDPEILTCSVCNFTANNSRHLTNHKLSHHGGHDIIYCTLCDFKSKTQVQHMKHMKTARGHSPGGSEESGILTCSICNFKASDSRHLMNHKLSQHNGDNLINCSVCGFQSQTHEQYNKHMKVAMGHVQKFSVQPCRFLNSCWRWPNCPYGHEDIPCRYQENCSNLNCPFVHYEPFLDLNDHQEFPPLREMEAVWRPW